MTSVEMQSKSDIRKIVLERRQGIASEIKKRSEIEILGHIRRLPEYRDAHNIAMYYPVQGEVNLLSLMGDDGKRFLFPKVHGNDLSFYPAETPDNFVIGRFGIPEPTSDVAVRVQDIDLIFVPALCYDDRGHRLGYGKGYYDRLLMAHPDVLAIGVSFDECSVPRLPVEPWDAHVDCVVTQTGVFRSNSARREVQ